jgi:hypothetical protein
MYIVNILFRYISYTINIKKMKFCLYFVMEEVQEYRCWYIFIAIFFFNFSSSSLISAPEALVNKTFLCEKTLE